MCYNCPASPSAPKWPTIQARWHPPLNCILFSHTPCCSSVCHLDSEKAVTLSPFLFTLLLLCAENKTSQNIFHILSLIWSKMQILTNFPMHRSQQFSVSCGEPTLSYPSPPQSCPSLPVPAFLSNLHPRKPLSSHLSDWLNQTPKPLSGFTF